MAKKRSTKTPPATSVRRVEFKDGDQVSTLYANNATVDVSNWDVKLRFGTVESATAEVVTARDLVHIYMSHSHFKAYVNALNGLVVTMESTKAAALLKASD